MVGSGKMKARSKSRNQVWLRGRFWIFLLSMVFVSAVSAGLAGGSADRGSFSPVPANLAQDSQKAIISIIKRRRF